MIVHEVITPEKVPITFRVAGVGARFLAWLLDASLIVLLMIAGLLFFSTLDRFRPGIGMAAGFIWMFVLTWGYFLVFEWLWLGQTPGKRAAGIRVIRERGTSIGFFHAAVRNVVRMVDALPAFYGLAFGVMTGHPHQRRLGDWAAGTLVVHVERKPPPVQALADAVLALGGEAVVRQRLGRLGREQKQTVLDLCLRRDQLRVADRARLFRAVSEYCQRELDLSPDRHQSDEKFVVGLGTVIGAETRSER